MNKEFASWFENSVVKTNENEPLSVYHGTERDFESFDKDMIGTNFNSDDKGFFFTDLEARARDYSDSTSYGTAREKSGFVYVAYLKLVNPLIVKIDFDPIFEWDTRKNFFLKKAEKDGHDGIIIKAEKFDSLYVAFKSEQIWIEKKIETKKSP